MTAKPKTLKTAVGKLPVKAKNPRDAVQASATIVVKNSVSPASQNSLTPSNVAKPAHPVRAVENLTVAPANTATHQTLKMKDLLDKVVVLTGSKKPQTREIIEATLAVLGDALSNGDTLNLPPLGRAKVSRTGDAGKPMTVKLRRSTGPGQGGPKANQALADAED